MTSMTIREAVARVFLADAGLDYDDRTVEMKEVAKKRAGACINAFLEATAEQDWHLRPDEATEEMVKQMWGFIWRNDRGPTVYRAILVAAPKFEWDK